MKKKNLKSLKLNKTFVSSFKKNKVVGGSVTLMPSLITVNSFIICESETCITTAQVGEELKPTCGNC
ncbi:hypothetical protein H2O64_17415 [Kordia sp. YSTF-M3]|uniref:Bacteriocin n=1 Tax=Kordia aestuariivivens TaxID=2759037 RepID=A0ABR7QD47_9FLAO|nr:hypothetical protein [Kordia aestuariivivens]MBC8756457.1 hypothetical protein [Kordia aestuariivivens]